MLQQRDRLAACGVAKAMSNNHIPGKHADWLRQKLAHDKKPLGALLGTGCPAVITWASSCPSTGCGKPDACTYTSLRQGLSAGGMPLIPDIGGLTQAVAEGLKGTNLEDPSSGSRVTFRRTSGGRPNIEDALSKCSTSKRNANSWSSEPP